MDHIRVELLADYVRGLGSPLVRKAIERHLSTGCVKCCRGVRALSEVAKIGLGESEYSVPRQAVRSVWAIFNLQRREMGRILPCITGRLVYDSFSSPLPAGARGRRQYARHVLYNAGSYSLDLRLEQRRASSKVALAGQLVDRREPDRPMAGLLVCVLRGKKIAASTASNAFGEFQLEYMPGQPLRLYVLASGDLTHSVSVSLSRIAKRRTVPGRTRGNKQRRAAASRRARPGSYNRQG